MKLFWTIWVIDLLAALNIYYYFFIGLLDGSVSDYNAGLWFLLLAGTGLVLAGSIPLIKKGKRFAAYALLSLLAVPALLMGIFLLILLVSDVHWQ